MQTWRQDCRKSLAHFKFIGVHSPDGCLFLFLSVADYLWLAFLCILSHEAASPFSVLFQTLYTL